MPTYLYKCETAHTTQLTHPVSEIERRRVCPECGTVMHRVPQSFQVNWNGLPPHQEHSQAVQSFIDTADARRDAYEAEREMNNAKEES